MAIFESGIDVSRYQGQINWPAVAAAGKQFAIVRIGATDRTGVYVDPYFLRNVNGAHAAGLKVGAYYYTTAKSEEAVINELDTFLGTLQGLKLEYPVFVDVEDNSLPAVGKAKLTQLTRFAMDILYQHGWYAGYYTYTSFANNYIDTASLAAYPLWIADYRGYVGYKGSYTMWQYSSTGSVGGINGNVDLDYSYTNFLPEIMKGGFNGYGSSGPNMQPISGQDLEVFSARCEYFYTANVNDVVDYLPLGRYRALSLSEGEYGGFVWVTFSYNNETYWTALLSDRCRLVPAEWGDCTECEQQLAAAREKIDEARSLVAQALDVLEP